MVSTTKTKSTNRLNGDEFDAERSIEKTEKKEKGTSIRPPDLRFATFTITGTAPLVVHRFSDKGFRGEEGEDAPSPGAKKKKKKSPPDSVLFNNARYISKKGWDGFNASGLRAALISACRLVGFKMTIAKMSIFVVAEGWDEKEPQIPLCRIRGCEAVMQKDITRIGGLAFTPSIAVRPAYHDWHAKVRIRWDNDQFKLKDVFNLLMRVGLQVGLCEGRPDSRKSGGMGWGTFQVEENVDHTEPTRE